MSLEWKKAGRRMTLKNVANSKLHYVRSMMRVCNDSRVTSGLGRRAAKSNKRFSGCGATNINWSESPNSSSQHEYRLLVSLNRSINFYFFFFFADSHLAPAYNACCFACTYAFLTFNTTEKWKNFPDQFESWYELLITASLRRENIFFSREKPLCWWRQFEV